jgi:hypothetical protein
LSGVTRIEVVDGRAGRAGAGRAASGLVDRVAVVATPAPDEQVPWLEPEFRAELATLREMGPEKAYGKLGVPATARRFSPILG